MDAVYHLKCRSQVSTCAACVPGCCSSFTVLPPVVLCPRPSCQVRFPPVRWLNWCLKSSDKTLYSTAGLQKLKLDAAERIREKKIQFIKNFSLKLKCTEHFFLSCPWDYEISSALGLQKQWCNSTKKIAEISGRKRFLSQGQNLLCVKSHVGNYFPWKK